MTHQIGRFGRMAVAASLLAALPLQAAAGALPPSSAAPCLTPGEVRALAAFSMPSALDGVVTSCAPHLPAAGFLRRSGTRLVARYAIGKAAAWPDARAAFLKLARQKDAQGADLIGKMGDAALQPFVEGMIGGLVGAKLKPGQCAPAETIIRLLAPLPPAHTVELLATMAALGGKKSRKGTPTGFLVCTT